MGFVSCRSKGNTTERERLEGLFAFGLLSCLFCIPRRPPLVLRSSPASELFHCLAESPPLPAIILSALLGHTHICCPCCVAPHPAALCSPKGPAPPRELLHMTRVNSSLCSLENYFSVFTFFSADNRYVCRSGAPSGVAGKGFVCVCHARRPADNALFCVAGWAVELSSLFCGARGWGSWLTD